MKIAQILFHKKMRIEKVSTCNLIFPKLMYNRCIGPTQFLIHRLVKAPKFYGTSRSWTLQSLQTYKSRCVKHRNEVQQKNIEKCVLFSITVKRLIWSRWGFLLLIGLNKLSIRFADSEWLLPPFPRYPTAI